MRLLTLRQPSVVQWEHYSRCKDGGWRNYPAATDIPHYTLQCDSSRETATRKGTTGKWKCSLFIAVLHFRDVNRGPTQAEKAGNLGLGLNVRIEVTARRRSVELSPALLSE